jgi:DNA (cytosine-5)-methyltransferase 1
MRNPLPEAEKPLRGGTLFSGIGSPELAAPWVDWRWCAKIDPFASAVLAARFSWR